MTNHTDSLAPAPLATPAAAHSVHLAADSAPAEPARPEPEPAGPTSPPILDAHGFDADDYDWLPVARRARADGWTAERQRTFIAVLSQTGLVAEAAEAVGMSVASAYRLRRARGAEQFDSAWSVALQSVSQVLADLAFERAINGQDVPVHDADGRVIRTRRVVSDRLLMFLLRAHQPQVYGPDAGRAIHHPRTVHVETHPMETVDFTERQCTSETTIERATTIIAPPGPIIGAPIADTLDALMPERPADPVAAMPADARDALADHIARCGLDTIDNRLANDFALAQWRAEPGVVDPVASAAETPAETPATDSASAATQSKDKPAYGRDLSDLSPGPLTTSPLTRRPAAKSPAANSPDANVHPSPPSARPAGIDPGYIVPSVPTSETDYLDQRMLELAGMTIPATRLPRRDRPRPTKPS